MNRTRIIFFAIVGITLLIVLLAVAYNFVMELATPAQPAEMFSDPARLPKNTVLLSIASSSTKQAWMEQVVANFHAEGKTTSAGSKIQVEVEPVLSGGSMNAILGGTLKPVVWSPGSPSWVDQFNETWRQQTNKTLISEVCPPVIYTPLGIAMWRPMAEALGWPDTPIGWQTIVDLASDPEGWASYGHPEWGKFRFGHAHPKYSNAGLLTVTSFVYGMAGKTDTLTAQEVYAPEVEAALRTLGQNTSKYGTLTTDLLDMMALQGPGYIHAVATFESDTVRQNMERGDELRFPLAFIFPAEGTFWGDHPYCILDKAEWVSAEQAEAAAIFLEYLLTREQQTLAIDSLLRPLDTSLPLRAPLNLEGGTDPTVNLDTVPALAFPSADVSAAITDLFMITKRKATVLLVLDVSGSMQGEKIRAATESTVSFLKRLHPDDRVGVMTFNNTVLTLSMPARVGDTVEQAANQVNMLIADGNTALYDAVCQATEIMKAERAADAEVGEQRLYGIVLLSDGEDTTGHPTENQMFATCLPAHAEADSFKIFPIAFGDDANHGVLKRIADVTGGSLFTADPGSIEQIYIKISAEQ
ncbi:MAG: extracellular solute-binding protein [Anaerolineae bacterium]|nr:extracellular solute-binding protein [Anaerolineae bacterium]